jgi:hypothetical protein
MCRPYCLASLVGTPSIDSTVTCEGTISQASNLVRVDEVVLCTIAARDSLGATTAVASDFGVPTTSEGAVTSPITGVDGSFNLTFQVTASSVVHVDHIITCTLAGGLAFSNIFTFSTGLYHGTVLYIP